MSELRAPPTIRPPDLPPSPPNLEPVVLASPHVRLEPLSRRHADDLAEAALAEPRIWDFMFSRIETRQAFDAWLQAAQEAHAGGLSLAFAVLDPVSGRAVGSTRLFDYRPRDRGVEIGHTWYAGTAWGTVINPACKLLLLRHAFEVLYCMRVQLKTDERNLRSRAAIEKLGARQEGILRKHMLVQDGSAVRSSVYFSIVDDDWPSVREGLGTRISEATHDAT